MWALDHLRLCAGAVRRTGVSSAPAHAGLEQLWPPRPPGEDGPISPPGAAAPQVLKANEGRAEHLYYIYFSIMAVVVLCAVDKGRSWPPVE